MPKQIDYPRASLKNSLQLAQAVDELGGKCGAELAADRLNKKMSGAFNALIGSALKFGLINRKQGQLEVTQLFRDYKLAYSKDEANEALVKAFLTPPLFKNIFSRFNNKSLPVSHFEKLLIRELDVPEQNSSRISKYFIEGAKQCGLLGPNNVLSTKEAGLSDASPDADEVTEQENGRAQEQISSISNEEIEEDGSFSIRIKGPGMDSVIVINDEEDLFIVEAMLRKVKKKLEAEEALDHE